MKLERMWLRDDVVENEMESRISPILKFQAHVSRLSRNSFDEFGNQIPSSINIGNHI